MPERRTIVIVGATLAALVVVALLGWRSYASIHGDESARIARRQQVLAGTIAIAIGSEVAARTTQLRQLNGLPSIQYVTEYSLPSRLGDLFGAEPRGPVAEVIRYTADGRLVAWTPSSPSLSSDSPTRAVIERDLLAWSGVPASRGSFTSALVPGRDGSVGLLIATPTYETALGAAEFQSPSGRHVGLLAFRLDIGGLVARYITHALQTSPESTAAVVVAPGRAAYARAGARSGDDDAESWTTLWPSLASGEEASRATTDRHGHPRIASWALVPDLPTPMVVWLDQSAAVADEAVWPLLLRQLPMFLLLAATLLSLAWALQRSYRSEDRYRALVAHAADGIIVLTPEGQMLEVNPAAMRIMGLSRHDAAGQSFASVLGPEQMRTWHQMLGAARAGTSHSEDFTIVRRDGQQLAASISLAPVSAGRLLAVVRDISQRRALEEQLRQAHKMEAVGRLAGGVAHDFNNLLTAILGYNELLLQQLAIDDPRREDAVELGRAAARAADLTQRLLAFGRRQMLEPRVFALNALIRGLERLLARLVGAPVHLAFDLAPDLWRVDADPGQIEQVLINLAVNARDAMPEGGHLRIATRNDTLTEVEAQALDLRAGDYVTLSVSDTGVGIADDVRPHVFEPFFTTKPLGTGTGLGLPTVYGIVQQSGGAIEVDSAPGSGTTLRIRLPRTHRPLPVPPPGAGEEAVPRGRATVLLVEDEPSVRRLLATGLRTHGYTVLEAADPLAALDVFAVHGASVGALVSDVMMPHMSGTALAHRLRVARPGLPIVLMSGYAMDVFDREPPPEGAVLLQKPFTAAVAARALAQLLQPV